MLGTSHLGPFMLLVLQSHTQRNRELGNIEDLLQLNTRRELTHSIILNKDGSLKSQLILPFVVKTARE